MRAQEGRVDEIVFQAFLRADVDPVAFDVDTQEISLRVKLGQPDGVFAFTAGEFEGEGMIVLEKGRPFSRHSCRVLKDVREGFDGFEADEFLLAHKGLIYRLNGLWPLRSAKLGKSAILKFHPIYFAEIEKFVCGGLYMYFAEIEKFAKCEHWKGLPVGHYNRRSIKQYVVHSIATPCAFSRHWV